MEHSRWNISTYKYNLYFILNNGSYNIYYIKFYYLNYRKFNKFKKTLIFFFEKMNKCI